MRIGVLCSNRNLDQAIQDELSRFSAGDVVGFHRETEAAIEYLNFELPDIVIINFSDSVINRQFIVEQIVADTWLHGFGIIGLFDKQKDDEETLTVSLKKLNILNLFEFGRLTGNLSKTIDIIRQNRQIISQRDISDRFTEKVSGSLAIDNDVLAVPSYVNLLAGYLYNKGFADEEVKTNLRIALSELILNGIEHGNCKIGYEEKKAFLDSGRGIFELAADKCRDPQIAAKRVTLEYEITPERSTFRIRDQGDGFDVRSYLASLATRDTTALLGRGIIMARSFCKKLTYNARGNEATLVMEHKPVDMASPQGFREEDAVKFKRGDIVFQEGEASNFVYYVLSGRFSVFHKRQRVGAITPADIFMGEMSFLLENRRSATVRAEEDSKLIPISKKSFINVIKRYPHYGMFLSRLIARKLARTNATTARYMSGEEEWGPAAACHRALPWIQSRFQDHEDLRKDQREDRIEEGGCSHRRRNHRLRGQEGP